ncbi:MULTISPECIES: hypothetical protein [Amycolatopsis]|uniref:Uncharacterized protein n=1 Tax=Amycolatopsis albidoflavus TaxID=102226 RepID=A0ABW5I9V5_9PSEU
MDYVVVLAGEVSAVCSFDLDHARAEIGESAGGQRGGDGLFDGDDGESVQREVGGGWVHAPYYSSTFGGTLG